ncbi:endolytic transglycosylase MltG [Candidatus Thioglobus sp.]|uniref:endolytic transglycosylase MltG n=1 Tax=Candidatus Thioglobus sp. TaxID=2026721 RepID=UPI003D0EE629
MGHIVLINGKKQAKLSVFNRLVQFGDGLFETCLVIDGKLILAQQHFQRLEKGAKRLQIPMVETPVWLKEISQAVSIAKLSDGVVKIILSRGETRRGYGYDENIQPTRIIIVSAMPDLIDGYNLSLCANGYSSNHLLAEIKHCNRLEQILARSHLKTQECIMLNAQAQVISVSQGNIFAIKNGILLTPDLSECGIQGTRRRVIIDLAKKLDITVKICPLSAAELLTCDEVFISNSIIGIKPVYQINEQLYPQHTLTNELTKAFNKHLLKAENSTLLEIKKSLTRPWLLIIFGLLLIWLLWANTLNTQKTIVYEVPVGATIHSTVKSLKDRGLIHSSLFVAGLAKLTVVSGGQLKAGFYDVSPDMSVWRLFNNFSAAHVATRDISLIEGKTASEYYQLLSNHNALIVNYSLAKTLEKSSATAPYDGAFWPDTYQVNYGDSVVSVFDRAHFILQKKLAKAWENRAKDLPLVNANQALILASLIEKETANNAEKFKIAGVFINRLKKNMRLQTDPTVIYALGDSYTGQLSKQDLQIKNPYNTYQNKGLPPGPIASVGANSLNSAMHPLKSDYLYFVAKENGNHVFAKTYKQHLININKPLK